MIEIADNQKLIDNFQQSELFHRARMMWSPIFI